MNGGRPKVVFIGGSGRSGTTLLQDILGQLDGFFAAGELRELWNRGAVKGRLCACGEPVPACATWRSILDRAFGEPDIERSRQLARAIESFRIVHLPRTYVPGLRRADLERLAGLRADLRRLYQAITEVTGCRVIVDSSKNPAYGYLVAHAGVELDVIHVVRDAPATAFSWGQRKEFEPGHMMRRRSPATAAMEWDAHNLATELILAKVADRYRRVRYEDLVAEPAAHLGEITTWLGRPASSLPLVADHEVDLPVHTHTVFGNATRFRRGRVELRPDDRWRTQMRRRDRLTVVGLTGPLRWRYGYPIGR